jgi:hypothetical protein
MSYQFPDDVDEPNVGICPYCHEEKVLMHRGACAECEGEILAEKQEANREIERERESKWEAL